MDEIKALLKEMAKDIVEIKVTLAKNTASLETHEARTTIAEQNISILRREVEPLKEHAAKVSGAASLVYNGIKVLAGVAAILAALHSLGVIRVL